MLNIGSRHLRKSRTQSSIVNDHTVIYKPIAPTDNTAQLEFNCSGHSGYSIDLISVRLILRNILVKTVGSDTENAEPNTVVCFNNLLHSMFSYHSLPLKGKAVNLHETNCHYRAYLEKLLNYGCD